MFIDILSIFFAWNVFEDDKYFYLKPSRIFQSKIIQITLNKNCYMSQQHVLTWMEFFICHKLKWEKSAPTTVGASDSFLFQDH